MKSKNKKVIVVGDRLLIQPDTEKDRTKVGLYLPQGVESKEKVQGGYVVTVGPGYPLPDPSSANDNPWQTGDDTKYIPVQAEPGDYALFLRKAGIEMELDGKKYIIVSQGAVLMLLRDDLLERIDP
jgi:co-chaperonin GroES (HSP10)